MRPTDAARADLQGRALRGLLIANQLVVTRLSRALQPTPLTLTYVSVLSHLRRLSDGASVGEIADAMEVNQPAVSKTLKALEELGAVTIERDADDARRLRVRITPRGGELLGQAEQAMHPAATAFFRGHSADELQRFVRELEALAATIDAPVVESVETSATPAPTGVTGLARSAAAPRPS